AVLLAVSLNISASSGRRKMKRISFDSSRRDGSNELRCILIRSLDAEIFNETCFLIFKQICRYISGTQFSAYILHILGIYQIPDMYMINLFLTCEMNMKIQTISPDCRKKFSNLMKAYKVSCCLSLSYWLYP